MCYLYNSYIYVTNKNCLIFSILNSYNIFNLAYEFSSIPNNIIKNINHMVETTKKEYQEIKRVRRSKK